MYISEVKDGKLVFRAVRTPDTDTETVCRISSEAAEIIAKIRKETGLTACKVASAMILYAAERCEIEEEIK